MRGYRETTQKHTPAWANTDTRKLFIIPKFHMHSGNLSHSGRLDGRLCGSQLSGRLFILERIAKFLFEFLNTYLKHLNQCCSFQLDSCACLQRLSISLC